MTELENNNYFFSTFSEKTRKLNELLLENNWKNVNFDDDIFQDGILLDEKFLNPEQIELLNEIIQNIPEWKRLLSCKQHNFHDYCLDIHTLSVVKKLFEFENFNKIDKYNKLILLYSALLHDIEKNENEIDPEHPAKGAKTSSSILFRLGFSEDFISKVYLLIKSHQVLGFLASKKISLTNEELTDFFKNCELLELQLMLSVADIKSVKKYELFFDKQMNEKFEEIINNIKKILNCNNSVL